MVDIGFVVESFAGNGKVLQGRMNTCLRHLSLSVVDISVAKTV